MENTQVCAAAKREKGASAARKRSDVRYRQQRDAGDTTSDGERWKVTGGVGRGGGGVRRWSSEVGGGSGGGGGGGPRRGGRQTIRGGGNGRSSRTVLTGHKYGEAGKVNRRRLRRQRLRGGKREAHFTASDAAAAAALLRQCWEGGWVGGRGGRRRREPSRQMECHARVLASAFVHRQHTYLHGGRDVGQGETLQVRQQAAGDHLGRLGGAGGSGRNWRRPKNKQRMKSSC